jgi:osmotically-inducible protein OsmY
MSAKYRDHASAARGPGTALLACALSAMAGAAIMYFLDPAWGRSRRAWLQQKAGALGRDARRTQDALARSTLNHVHGALHTIHGMVDEAEQVDDVVLVERVRAALGRTIANPHGIEVKAFDGRVVLRGPVTPEELAEIVACTQRVRGVREVDNRLSPNTGLGGNAPA